MPLNPATRARRIAADGTRPARWIGLFYCLLGLMANRWVIEFLFAPDGSIIEFPKRAAILVGQAVLIGVGAWLAIRQPLSRIPWSAVPIACITATMLFGAFAVLDIFFPTIITVPGILYFELRSRYQPDSTLVFRRWPNSTIKGEFNGDLYDPDYGIAPLRLPYTSTYNEFGFRSNSSGPPYEVVLLGDSFLEIGEDDRSTLSEQLATILGRPTLNLGLEWYGPHQYIETFRRYGRIGQPRVAVFCFFSGNDVSDIRQYRAWQDGGSYGPLDPSAAFVERFRLALWSTIGALEKRFIEERSGPATLRTKNDRLAQVRVGPNTVPMRFAYWKSSSTVREVLDSEEWKDLASILTDFRDLSRERDVAPLVVFVPTTLEVYGPLVLPTSGKDVLTRLPLQLRQQDRDNQALRITLSQLEIPLVDLLPVFRERAQAGELLYYPFDTHWTPLARVHAARLIADAIRASGRHESDPHARKP